MNSDNDLRDIDILKQKYRRYKSQTSDRNSLAKIYEIDVHGKFTVIVRSLFVPLPVRPTTNTYPCYPTDSSSLCDLAMSSPLHERKKERKGKTWKSLYGKLGKWMKHEVTSTLFIHSSTTHPSVITQEEGSSYYGLYLSLFVICFVIVGLILWYIFVKSTQSPRSTIHLTSEDDDLDETRVNDQYQIQRLNNSDTDLNSSQTHRIDDALLFNGNHNTNYFEKKCKKKDSCSTSDQKINYENIQMLIDNLQQSTFESINSSVISEILSDLIHQAVKVVNTNPQSQSFTDLQTFLCYAPQFFRLLRTLITSTRSDEQLNAIQCQYLIDILHHLEFILHYLHRHHSHQRTFLIDILTHVDQILASMKSNNSDRHRYIRQSLSDILEKLNRQ